MRNLPSSGGAANRGGARGADPDAGFLLAGPNQSRYKGVITSPGVVKFSAWKRENDIPRYNWQWLLTKDASAGVCLANPLTDIFDKLYAQTTNHSLPPL